MRVLYILICLLSGIIVSTVNIAHAITDGVQEFIFNLNVPKNICDITIKGGDNLDTSNLIDFGNIQLKNFKSDVPAGKVVKPFTVTLDNCKTSNHDGAYIKLTGNYSQENNGFLDDTGKSFAIRISQKNNATQGDTAFFTETNNKIWTNIKDISPTNKYYAYVMCKTGVNDCSGDENVGPFRATLTITYVSD